MLKKLVQVDLHKFLMQDSWKCHSC